MVFCDSSMLVGRRAVKTTIGAARADAAAAGARHMFGIMKEFRTPYAGRPGGDAMITSYQAHELALVFPPMTEPEFAAF